MLDKLFGLIGLWIAILGAHGLYVRFSRWDVLLGSGTSNMLFLAIDLPIDFLDKQIYWMSNKGFQSLFIPAIFLMVGIFLFIKRKEIARWMRGMLRKI